MTFGPSAGNVGLPDYTTGAPPPPLSTGSVGGDTTAPESGQNPRGQILGVPQGYVPPRWIVGYGPMSEQQYEQRQQQNLKSPWMSPQDRAQFNSRVEAPHDPYREADAWNPASNPQQVPGLQQKLIKLGLLDPTSPGYVPGLWGANEVAAIKVVLSDANLYGTDMGSMLDYMLAHPGFTSKPTKQVMLTSPIDVEQAFRQAYKAALGHDPSGAATSAFVSSWQQYESSLLTDQATAQSQFQKDPSTAPGSVTGVSSPSSFAANYVDTNFAGEEHGQGVLHGLDLVHQLIDSTKGAGG